MAKTLTSDTLGFKEAVVPGFIALVVCDLKRFWLQPVRIVGRMIQPLLYLFVLGAGISGSSVLGNRGYPRYIFAGVIAMSLLNTATFCATNLVFDREIGFFKAVLVAPISRRTIAAGKVTSGALVAWMQSLPLILAAPFVGLHPDPGAVLATALAMALSAAVFSALGVAVASRLNESVVFPIVITGVLLPMFFLGGTLFPLDMAPVWLQRVALLDPVTYGADLIRGSVVGRFHFHPVVSVMVLSGLLALLVQSSVAAFERGEDV